MNEWMAETRGFVNYKNWSAPNARSDFSICRLNEDINT